MTTLQSATAAPSRAAGFRPLPHSIEAERGLLGAIFLDNSRAYEAVSDFLRPEHFARLEHRRIFECCAQMIDKGSTVDPITLAPHLVQSGVLDDVGGAAYLIDLADSAVTAFNAGEYGRMIYDLYLRRELIGFGGEVVETAYAADLDAPASKQIEKAEGQLYGLAERGATEGGFRPFADAVCSAIEMAQAARNRGDELVGVTTGLNGLDAMLGGLHPSDLIIVAGRPGMGKTAFATNIATNAAYAYRQTQGSKGAQVALFSLEMSSEQLASRILCEQLGIPSDQMRRGRLTNEEFVRLVQGTNELKHLPITIDDTPALMVSALRSRARRLKRQKRLDLLVVDYLQLLAPAAGARYENRVQELSAITRSLKTIAKELDVPVIAISQLSRAVEQRPDKRPMLSDLRESGSIEQDADVVLFLYRAEYYKKLNNDDVDDDAERNLAEAIIAKHRHGATDTVLLRFIPEYTRFADRQPPDNGTF